MRIHARTLIFLAACAALLVLAVRLVNYRRQHTVDTGAFALSYETAVQKLRAQTVALSRKMAQNGAYDPALIAVPELPPVDKPAAAVPSVERLVLQGVSWSIEMPLALINDKLYKTGDRLGGFTIETILPYSVIVRNADGAATEIKVAEKKKP